MASNRNNGKMGFRWKKGVGRSKAIFIDRTGDAVELLGRPGVGDLCGMATSLSEPLAACQKCAILEGGSLAFRVVLGSDGRGVIEHKSFYKRQLDLPFDKKETARPR